MLSNSQGFLLTSLVHLTLCLLYPVPLLQIRVQIPPHTDQSFSKAENIGNKSADSNLTVGLGMCSRYSGSDLLVLPVTFLKYSFQRGFRGIWVTDCPHILYPL